MNTELGSVISVTCWDIFACFHFQSVPSRFNPSLWRNSLQLTSVNHQFATHIVTLCLFSRRPFISNQVNDSQLVGDLVFLCDFHRPVFSCTYIASEKSSVRNFHVYSPIYCFDSELCNCFTEVVRGEGEVIISQIWQLFSSYSPLHSWAVFEGELEQMKQFLRLKIAVQFRIFLWRFVEIIFRWIFVKIFSGNAS